MAAATPLSIPFPPYDPIAVELARRNPVLAAELRVSVSELATLAATTATLSEAEDLGWISPEERRLYQGEATAADLRAMGYADSEAHALLEEQRQDWACASSS